MTRRQHLGLIALMLTALLLPGLMLLGCDAPKQESKGMGDLMGSASGSDSTSGGYAKVLPGKPLSFPKDHLAHDDFRQEWWYLTANLTTDTGEPLGLQWTQFRIALSPSSLESPQSPGTKESPTSETPKPEKPEKPKPETSWATKQLYMAHSAVTTSKIHKASERWSRAHPKLAGTKASPLTIALDDWRWQSEGDDLFPATLTVNSDDFSYQLMLSSGAPLQRQGDEGYSIKSADGEVASYYYSQPFIAITGSVTLDGKVRRVGGQGWLDREWSSQFLTRQQQGWDWFALRLDDASTLMLFQLRSKGDSFYSARRMFADGSGRNIKSSGITMKATEWQKIDGANYPIAWQIAIPSEQLNLSVSPLNPDSLMPLSVRYWEGPIQVSGSHRGQGYMELTGY
ncbi:carotenoid 1,2-hydratase [Shewanella rhizosphaerae]|uniref:lipocalin-like domain-containing protein n=1 Tax=Shewanella rhizosphaerae TaxID=2864207 RepID=UPI001C662450|nr:lipocalin-like domain-containing protein [Shewanella rhizosphaerae]QYK12330.1 carotenoid 1,2-hydratase [Shewanella rhizosphaerae]